MTAPKLKRNLGGRPRTRPPIGTPAFRKLHRERMSELRAAKAAAKPPECRQCHRPAAVDPETGRVLSMCRPHLDADAKRVKKAYKRKVANG